MSKETTENVAAPKWGTKEWIAAHPWSGMDRRRKRRVLAALPPECAEALELDTGGVPFLHALALKVPLRKKTADRVARLLAAADAAAVKIADLVAAAALERAWAVPDAAE